MDMYNNGTRIVYFSTIIIFLLLLLLLLQLLNIIITCQILISANPLNQVGPIINLRTVNTTKNINSSTDVCVMYHFRKALITTFNYISTITYTTVRRPQRRKFQHFYSDNSQVNNSRYRSP